MIEPNALDQIEMLYRAETKGERYDLLSATKLKTYLSLDKLGLMYCDQEDGLIWSTEKGQKLLVEIENQFKELCKLL